VVTVGDGDSRKEKLKDVADKDGVILSMRLFASLSFQESCKGWGKKRKIESETGIDRDKERA
jgi:hypothetical protein